MDIKQLWSDWNCRVLILLSLLIQVILIFLGRWRKNSTSRWIQMFVWSTYILADWVADFALGILSRAMYDSASNAIIAFWAPFLILHLGGPDTITAYSMEDNELWSRRLLGLGYELTITFYVLFCSLPNTYLLTPTLLIFLVATIKCVERIYSLYKASSASFRKSIGSSVGKLQTSISPNISNMEDLNDFNEAFGLYFAYKHFFVDVIPHLQAYNVTGNLVQDMIAKKALRVIGMELSYAYDELYTKAAINHSKVGYVLRALCFICLLLAFLLYVLAPKNSFNKFEVMITYVLLVASIFLDIMATIMLLFSDWMLVSLLNAKKPCNWTKFLTKCIVRSKIFCLKEMYWSGEMPQLNLISDCLKNFASNKALQRKMINWIEEKLSIIQEIKLYPSWNSSFQTHNLRSLQSVYVTQELQEIIITYAQKCLHESREEFNEFAGLSTLRQVTTIPTWVVPSFVKLMEGLLLDQQVLVWHIATNLLFHWKSKSHHTLFEIEIEAENDKIGEVMRNNSEMEACMYLSNYMMHMVLMRPEIMSTMGGASPSMFWKAYDDMVQFIKNSGDGHDLLMPNAKVEVCRKMVSTPIKLTKYSSLFQMARVLSRLMLVIEKNERWIIITMVWVELMMQGVTNTKASILVKQLSRGREVFTFIWLLSKHVRMEKTPISEGYMMRGTLEAANELLTNIELYGH